MKPPDAFAELVEARDWRGIVELARQIPLTPAAAEMLLSLKPNRGGRRKCPKAQERYEISARAVLRYRELRREGVSVEDAANAAAEAFGLDVEWVFHVVRGGSVAVRKVLELLKQ